MKATELRIGNWANNGEKDYVIDRSSMQDIINFSEEDFTTDWKPIPLTGEWLERFGFFKDGEYWYRRPAKIPPIYWVNSKPLYGINLGSPSLGMFSYVHQLQNLYFALTGEELQTDETNQKVN